MRQSVRVLFLTLALWALLPAPRAGANPETGPWLNLASGAADRLLEFGETLSFAITSTTDSQTFTSAMPQADLCFDPDLGGAAGAARITVYRAVNPAVPTINGSIILPTIPTDNSDCTVIVNGTYWVEVTTGPAGIETPVVTVTARSN